MSSRVINSRHPCRSLTDYLSNIKRIQKEWRTAKVESKGNNKPLWFRGQRSAEWDLRPKLYRDEYAHALESELRLEFEGNGLQLSTTNLNRSKWEWYFLMQHYGAPTRLLDWTGNPLAALYFAVSDEGEAAKNHDAAVWMFDPWRWNKLHFEGLSGPSLPDWEETQSYLPSLEDACDGVQVQKRWPIAIEPPSIDRRLANQTARFLLFGKKKDLIKAANRTDSAAQRKKRSRLVQIVIDRESLAKMRCELDDLEINHRILFPDLQGLGTHLSWEWKRFAKPKRL